MATESASSITQLRRFMTRHSVTIQDFDGTSHTAEVTASSLFEAVAQNLRRLGATLRRSGECSVSASPALAPNAIEAATIRKVQTRIIPLVFFLFLIAFIDRINIGFAALTMNKALAITSQQFGLLSGIFFWDYFLFEIPSNLLLHKLGARMWIARILVTWGILAMLTGLATTATHFIFCASFVWCILGWSHKRLLRSWPKC